MTGLVCALCMCACVFLASLVECLKLPSLAWTGPLSAFSSPRKGLWRQDPYVVVLCLENWGQVWLADRQSPV